MGGATGYGALNYMHARYQSPYLGRFLTVDPVESGMPSKPQSWHKYAYALNNPVAYVDPDGEFAQYAIRAAHAGYKVVTRAVARKTARSGGDVFVFGRGEQAAQRSLAREAYGRGNIKRHTTQEGSLPHLQPKKRAGLLRTGHIFKGKPGSVAGGVATVAAAGAAAGDAVEAATGSSIAGDTAQFVIDFVNPATALLEGEQLLETVGIDIIEAAYDVDLTSDETCEQGQCPGSDFDGDGQPDDY
jgi:RHS repeat-associated protein